MTKQKKIKNEAELIREVIRVGSNYIEKRGAGRIDESDPQKQKLEFIYRILVHDKHIQPLAYDQLSDLNIRRRLATWMMHQLPEDHPLLK